MKTFTNCAEKKAKQFLNLLQGYTKGIRMTAILVLLLMGVSNAWAEKFTKGEIRFYTNAEGDKNWYFETSTVGDWVIQSDVTTGFYLKRAWCNIDKEGGNVCNDTYLHYNLYKQSDLNTPIKSGDEHIPNGSWENPVYFNKDFNNGNGINILDGVVGGQYVLKFYFTAKVGSDCGGTIYLSNNSNNYNIKFTYNPTYNVTVTAGTGGNVAQSSVTAGNINPVTLPKATPSNGYSFDKWKITSGDLTLSNETSANAATVKARATGTVTANFKGNTYKVTLNNQSATTAGTASVTATYGSAMPSANMPAKTGYTFGGYYTTTNGGGTQYYNANGASAKNWAIASNSTLYAKWTANQYTITYKDQGNVAFSGTHASTPPTKHTYGTATTLKTATKTGYTFGGWHTDQACTNKVTSLGATTYTDNITLYAKWTINQYTLTYSAGEGGSVTATVGGNPISSPAVLNYNTQVVLTATPTGENAFTRWVDGNGNQLSTANPYTHTFKATTTIKAEFSAPTTVYLKPEDYWKSDNACFAIVASATGKSDKKIDMESADCENIYYKVDIPAGYTEFKYVRLDPNNKNTIWNETGKLYAENAKGKMYVTPRIYFKPNIHWKSDNARFAVYFWNSLNDSEKTWRSLESIGNDLYTCQTPGESYDRAIFCRMNPNTVDNNFNNGVTWNKTNDLYINHNSIAGKNLYTITKADAGNMNGEIGEWHTHWETFAPTYTVTLDPFQYGEYGITFDGKTYKSKPTEEVIIEYVPLGTKIQLIDAVANTPHYGHKLDNNGDRMYESAVVVKHNSTSSTNYHIGAETEFTHTLCGTTTFRPNMVTTAPHRVYLHIPQNLLEGWNKTNSGATINCVYATEYLTNKNDGRPGALVVMTKDTYLSGLDNGDYYYCDIPEGYHYFYFERKITNNDDAPKNSTIRFNYEIPLTNLNCFNLDGTDSSGKYTGEWGVAPASTGDYRLLYVEQVVEKSKKAGDEWKPVITRKKAHPSDIIRKRTESGVDTVSLHTYKDRKYAAKLGNGLDDYESSNNPEIILQRCTGFVDGKSQWEDVECQMVYGPLETLPIMANLPGRKNASPGSNIDDLRYHNGIENIKKDVLNHPDKGNGVWNFVVKQEGDNASVQWDQTHRYTGEYYIRTDNAEGGWDQYTLPGNYMTYSQYAKDHSGFSHYFCKWVDVAQDPKNVKFTIANDYGVAISDTLGVDTYTNQYEQIEHDANIRWSWNIVDNKVARAYIQGTWKEGVPESASYEERRNRNLVVNYKSSYTAADQAALLDDSGDWIYQKDFTVKVGSHLNSLTATYPVNSTNTQTFAKNLDMLTGGESNETYKVRVLYDFKINKTLVALVPNDKDAIISIDVLIERINQGEATQVQAPIAYTNNQRSGEGSTVYGVMSFDKSHLTDPSLSSQQKLTYWISFPFDVKLSEIFGFGEVGDYWMIKYYDGKDRAAKGLYDDNTFWKFITNRNYTLKANQGYVLSLNKKVMNANSPIFTNTNRISLYFPSLDKITEINPKEYTQTTCNIPEHTCTIISPTDRRTKDSNWNFIGVPSYANKNCTTTTTSVKYFYDYNYQNDTYAVAQNGGPKKFQSMFAYMVQFAGIIDWSTFSFTSNGGQGLAAKKTANVEKHVLRIELQQNNTKADQTYIQLEDEEVTAMFDMNYDLTKLFNSKTNIYSLIPSDTDPIQVAANVMPIEETIIPLGIKLDAAGEYTFAMPDGTDGIVVELIDYEANTTTNMLLDNYTVNLGKGTFENRFALHVKPNKTTTSIVDVNTNTTGVKKYLIDGILYMQKDGVLYDAQGKLVR